MLQEATRREQVDHDLLRRYQDHHDLQAHDELVRRFVPLVRSIACTARGSDKAFELLQQAGMEGLLAAFDGFDGSGRQRFVSAATLQIRREIRRHVRGRGRGFALRAVADDPGPKAA